MWTGKPAPIEVMLKAAKQAMGGTDKMRLR
jgi:hypothetical protein